MTTNSPQSIAEALARKCASGLAMDSAHIPIISHQILQSIPLVELLELRDLSNKLLQFYTMEHINKTSDDMLGSEIVIGLSNLNTKLRELKVIE